MRAYQIQEPSGLDALKLVDLPDPGPAPGQVLVRMKAVSLNYRDLVVLRGGYGRGVKMPLIPCSDGAGEVIAIGDGVTRAAVGDRVAGTFAQGWLDGPPVEAAVATALGGAIDGVLAENVVFPENGVVPAPPHLGWEEAATLPCAAVTAWNALIASGGLQPGQTVLTLGSGGVSLFALQIARMRGAGVIATSSSEDKLDRLKSLGASEVINYRTEPRWGERVAELTGGVGVDHVVEVGGLGTLEQSLRAVRYGGTVSFIGVVAGGGECNLNRVFMRAIRLQGIFAGSREMFQRMNHALTESRIRPVIDRVFAFSDAAAAFGRLESGKHFGKVVIRL